MYYKKNKKCELKLTEVVLFSRLKDVMPGNYSVARFSAFLKEMLKVVQVRPQRGAVLLLMTGISTPADLLY